MPKKLFLRQSTVKDFHRIKSFYKDNDHKYVAVRDEKVMKERIKDGSATMLEDEDGNIKAISIAYPVIAKDKNGDELHIVD